MVQRIAEEKNRILEYLGKSIDKYGPDKMNVEEIGKLADAVKDMAEAEKACWEAEYYQSVTEAMDSRGYMPEMDYGDGMMRGYRRRGYNPNRDSRGRYSRGYHEDMEAIRQSMGSASPEEREKMKRELRQMLDM